jgi:hypothetical protein
LDVKGLRGFRSKHLGDSAVDPITPDLVEPPAPTNLQVNQTETELNCIDQLMQDHIASCLARSIDPFPRDSLQGNESQESMYFQLPRISNTIKRANGYGVQ